MLLDTEIERLISDEKNTVEEMRDTCFVSCWHIREHDSPNMWSTYLQGQDGIAIQTTYERLRDSFEPCSEAVMLGKVVYKDHQQDRIFDDDNPVRNLYRYVLWKRRNYEDERELRAVTKLRQDGGGVTPSGLLIKANLQTLIERIYVSPKASGFVLDAIKAIVIRWNLDKPVIKSDILISPDY